MRLSCQKHDTRAKKIFIVVTKITTTTTTTIYLGISISIHGITLYKLENYIAV